MAQATLECPVCGSKSVHEDKLINRYTCLSCGHKFKEEEIE